MLALCRWGPRCAVPACVRLACWLRGCWKKKPAGRRSACPAPFSAQQNACGRPARRACHHGRHCAAQPARGHSLRCSPMRQAAPWAHRLRWPLPRTISRRALRLPCRYITLRAAVPKALRLHWFGPGRAGGRPGGIFACCAAFFFAPVFERPAGAGGGVMLQVSFAQLLAAGFSFRENSACAAGLAVGTLCMGVGLTLCNAARSGIMPCV